MDLRPGEWSLVEGGSCCAQAQEIIDRLADALEKVGDLLPDPMHPNFPREFRDRQAEAIMVIANTIGGD